MVNVMKRQTTKSNASSLIRPVNPSLRDYLLERAEVFPATPAAARAYNDTEPLPSMFRRGHTTATETNACQPNGTIRFSPYVIAFVLLAVAPAQAALLSVSCPIGKEEVIEQTLVLARKGVAEIAAWLSMPAAAKRNIYPADDND